MLVADEKNSNVDIEDGNDILDKVGDYGPKIENEAKAVITTEAIAITYKIIVRLLLLLLQVYFLLVFVH